VLVFFIQKLCLYRADRAPERILHSQPLQGDKIGVFSPSCALFQGWLPLCFSGRKQFFGVFDTTFSPNGAGLCTHIAGELTYEAGTTCAQF
jgi:hypothetical protein